MGISRGEFQRVFKQRDAGRSRTQTGGMGPIGSNPDITPVDVTIVFRDERGRWVYGGEVKADRATRERVLPRGPDGSVDHFYMRAEYEFAVDKLKRAGGDRPATLVCAAMPAGYATVFAARLQTGWAKESMTKLPDSYDTEDGEGFTAKFNPLGFTPKNLAARRSAPDLKAIADIAAADRDIYLTKSAIFRASFAGALVGEAFHDYNPGNIETRWVRGQSKTLDTARNDDRKGDSKHKAPEDAHRLGLVLADTGSIKSVAAEIIVGLNDFRNQLEKNIRAGFLVRAKQRIKADATLDNLIDDAIELGVWQALAGIDEQHDAGEGAEVSTLARRYAEYHLAVWNKGKMREAEFFRRPMPENADGELLHGVGAVAATQDEFETNELLARLDSTATERERHILMIEILKTADLGLNAEEIAAGVRLHRRQIRRLDDAAD